ncbi:MAG: M23 family metallopeptidase, partial [Ilumatobacteraceae bacterium]
MRRIVAIAGLAVLPVIAWRAASAEPDPPPDCNVPAAAAPEECVAAAPAAPVDPVPGSEVSTTTTLDPSSTVGGSSTTIDPNAPTTTVDPDAPTTTVDPNATTTSTAVTTTTTITDPGATTTTTDPDGTTTTAVDPGSTTTIDPNATTTTVIDPNATTTTMIDPNATTTTVIDPDATTTTLDPLLVEDADSEPVLPPVEAPGGRVVLPAGVVETGQTRSITFPVAGPVTYGNDWGACRDGCARAHKGIDIIGDRLQPILAMHDGVIDHLVDHPTAGNGVAIRDDDGWQYHVYHVNNDTPGTDDGADPVAWRYAPGIEAGVRVTAGQLIGWMGDSGNSEGSVPHAHVEIHLPTGQAVNPYWSLRQAQRDVNCAVGTVETDPSSPIDEEWLRTGWDSAALPAGWQPLTLTGGRPGSGATNARMWIAAAGFTPVDSAALRAGDARYDAGVDCTTPVEPQLVAPIPTELTAILSTIRAMESGGDYTVSVTTSTASGAYGFLDSSWGGYGGYRRAKDAPPAVQDAKAAEL